MSSGKVFSDETVQAFVLALLRRLVEAPGDEGIRRGRVSDFQRLA